MDELIARLAKVPLPQRLAALAGSVVLIVILTWFFAVDPKDQEIVQLNARIERVDAQLAQKKAIARNLTRYRVEVERLKQRLNEALTLLPNEAEIPELLQKLATLVEQSDCQMKEFEPQSEITAGFYARIPVKMSVSGNYHSIAVFFDKVAKLSRIVNITDIQLKKQDKLDANRIMLTANFLATTFKFIDRPKPKAQGAAGAAGGAATK